MADSYRHEQLIDAGLAFHEGKDYVRALPLFQVALAETPQCVSAQYNVANTLHMLGRDAEAIPILTNLLATDDETFISGCPLAEDPTPFKLDALFLMFLTTLFETESWSDAFPYAINHLNARRDNVESVFSDEHIASKIKSLKLQYQS